MHYGSVVVLEDEDVSFFSESFIHYCQVSCLLLVLYDHALTLDREIEYIWKRKWSTSKGLYLFARYFGHVLMVLPEKKQWLYGAVGLKFVGTGSMVTILTTQIIMQSRVKALYGRRISIFITIAYAVEVVAVLSLGIASLAAIDVAPLVISGGVCNPTYLPPFATYFWAPVITFEGFLFLMALRIAYHNYLDIGNWRGAALLHILLRDNFLFFVCAFASYIVTARTWSAADPRFFTVPGAFSCAFTTIMGCRLVLNLCQAYFEPDGHDTSRPHTASIWAATTKDVRFRRPMPRHRTTTNASGSAWESQGGGGGVGAISIGFRSPGSLDERESRDVLDGSTVAGHGPGGAAHVDLANEVVVGQSGDFESGVRDRESLDSLSFASRIKAPSGLG